MSEEPTSPSSRESEDSTSRRRRAATSASDKSRTIQDALPFSTDTGRQSRSGATSTTSTLLPTPNTFDDLPATRTAAEREADQRGGFANLRERVSDLLPTPDAGAWNDGQTAETHADRHARERAKSYNGNGGGTPLAAFVPMLDQTSSSAASLASRSPKRGNAAARTILGISGQSFGVSLASFDPASSSWRTFQGSLLSEVPPSLATLPRSGMTRRGLLFELRTSELLTGGSGGSVSRSIPTPTASDAIKARGPWKSDQHREGSLHSVTLVDFFEAALGLLPTPSATETKGHGDGLEKTLFPTPVSDHTRGNANPSSQYESLPNAVTDLLPTPRLGGMVHGYGEEEVQAGDPKHRLETRIEVQRRRSSGEPTDPRSSDGPS